MFILHTNTLNDACREFEFPFVLVSKKSVNNLPNCPIYSYPTPKNDQNDTAHKAEEFLRRLKSLKHVKFEYIDFLDRKIRMKIISTTSDYRETWGEICHELSVAYFMDIRIETLVKSKFRDRTIKNLKSLTS